MKLYTIYRHPKDYPLNYVVRLFNVSAQKVTPTNEIFVVNSLEEARNCVPNGSVCIDRSPEDDPVIVETWL